MDNQNPNRFNVFDDGVGIFPRSVSRDTAERVFKQLRSNGSYKVELVEEDSDGDYQTIRRA